MIRLGQDSDAPGYRALIAACWAEYPTIICDFDAEMPEVHCLATTIRSKGGELWAAEADGTIIGMVAVYPAEDGWQLSRMYVAATHRGTGLAARLVACAEDHARHFAATHMILWTDVLFSRAHAFYEKLGYRRCGQLRALNDLSGSIEAQYRKPLTDLESSGAASCQEVLQSGVEPAIAETAASAPRPESRGPQPGSE